MTAQSIACAARWNTQLLPPQSGVSSVDRLFGYYAIMRTGAFTDIAARVGETSRHVAPAGAVGSAAGRPSSDAAQTRQDRSSCLRTTTHHRHVSYGRGGLRLDRMAPDAHFRKCRANESTPPDFTQPMVGVNVVSIGIRIARDPEQMREEFARQVVHKRAELFREAAMDRRPCRSSGSEVDVVVGRDRDAGLSQGRHGVENLGGTLAARSARRNYQAWRRRFFYPSVQMRPFLDILRR